MDLLAEGFDAVVNFAAESHVDRSIESARDFIARTSRDAGLLETSASATSRSSCRSRPTRSTAPSIWAILAVHRVDTLAPTSPYAASRRPRISSSSRHSGPSGSRRRDAVLEQLRAVSIPREVSPADDPERLQGKPLPIYGDASTCATGSTRRTTAARSRRRSAGKPVRSTTSAATARGRTSRWPGRSCASPAGREPPRARHRSPRARSAVRGGRREARAGSLVAPGDSLRRRTRLDGALVQENEPWWRRIVEGSYLVDRRAARSAESR